MKVIVVAFQRDDPRDLGVIEKDLLNVGMTEERINDGLRLRAVILGIKDGDRQLSAIFTNGSAVYVFPVAMTGVGRPRRAVGARLINEVRNGLADTACGPIGAM